MQIFKVIHTWNLKFATKQYLSICALQLINIFMNIHIHLLYTLIPIKAVFFCFEAFFDIVFYFHEKFVGSVKDIAC